MNELSSRQARILAVLIRTHLGLSIYELKRTPDIDSDLQSLLSSLDELGKDE